MTEQFEQDYTDAVEKIDDATDEGGNYANNIVGSILRSFAAKYGYDKANDLIDECNVTENHDIPKVEK